MTRKSKNMTAHKSQIKKLCIATICLGFIALNYTSEVTGDIIKQTVHAEYKLRNQQEFKIQPSHKIETMPVQSNEIKIQEFKNEEKSLKKLIKKVNKDLKKIEKEEKELEKEEEVYNSYGMQAIRRKLSEHHKYFKKQVEFKTDFSGLTESEAFE